MRKILHLLTISFAILIHNFYSSQIPIGEYKITVDGTGKFSNHATCEKEIKIGVKFSDNSTGIIAQLFDYPEGKNFAISGTLSFPAKKK